MVIKEESEKETDPTMNERKETEDNRLRQKYALIQQQWDDYKRTRTIGRNMSRSCSTNSRVIVKALKQQLLLLDRENSPRALMSSLQRYPRKVVRKNSNAVEDVLRERRAAIQSGRLKGRRLLFGEEEEEEEMVCSGFDDFVVEDRGNKEDGHEVELGVCYEYCNDESCDESLSLSRYPKSSSSSHSSFVCDECLERQIAEKEDGEHVDVGPKFGVGSEQGRSRKVAVRFLVSFWLILCVIAIILSKTYRGFYCGRNAQLILVPT